MELIIPGQKIYDYKLYSNETYVEGNKTYAAVLAMMRDGKFIPLKGIYKPKKGDFIVGIVKEESPNGWVVDLNLPFSGFIPKRTTRIKFELGNIITGRIGNFGRSSFDIVDVRKLRNGKILEFPTKKIPRLIGKRNNMINLITQKTNTKIFAGSNGYVYLEGGNLPLALKAIKIIENEAHTSGLTQRISDFLDKGEINEK